MKTQQTPQEPPRTKWGRSRFGGSGRALIAASLTVGAILSLGIAWAISLMGTTQDRPWLIYAIGVIVTLPVTAMGTWALLVDRSTLTGAPNDPDSSVESRWYDKAAAGAYHVLIATLGLGAALLAFLKVDISPPLLLMGVFGIGAAAFWISYFVARKADS